MYSVSEKKTKGKIIDTISINGFPMGSKDKVFKISNSKVRKIKITNKKLANPLPMRTKIELSLILTSCGELSDIFFSFL